MRITSATEYFDYELERCYLNDGQIVFIKAPGDVSRPAIDTYTALMIDSVNNFPDPKVTYLLLNLSSANLSLTPYARTKTIELLKSVPPHRTVYAASVYANRALIMLVTLFVNAALKVISSKIIVRTFMDVEQAALWLEECRKKEKQKIEA